MSYEVKKLEKSSVEITITIEKSDAAGIKKSVVNKIKKQAELPGFRKGKAPESVILERFDGLIKEEIADKVIKDNYEAILDKEDIKPVDYIKLVNIDIAEDIKAVFTVDVYPEVKLGDYKGLEVEKEKYEIKEEDVEKEISMLKDKNSVLKEAEEGEEAKLDDTVTISFEGFVDGEAFEGGKSESYDLKLGSKTFVDTFEDQIVGHKVGDEFEVNVTFPENYKEELANKEALFKVGVKAIKRVEAKEVNDEFAKEVGFDTLEELKESKKIELEKREETRIEQGYINTILEKIKAGSEVEIPESLVIRETENRIKELESQLKAQGMDVESYLKFTGSSKDKMYEDLRPIAEEKVKMDIIIDEIAKLEKVEITDEEIEEKFAEVASYYGMEMEKLKDQLKQVGNYENFVESLKLQKITQKTIDLIVSETIEK